MDAVTKVEENEFGMRLEDLIPEVTGKDDLLQSYLKTQANLVSTGSQQTLLTEVESLLEPPVREQGESNGKSDTEPVDSARAKEDQRFTKPQRTCGFVFAVSVNVQTPCSRVSGHIHAKVRVLKTPFL